LAVLRLTGLVFRRLPGIAVPEVCRATGTSLASANGRLQKVIVNTAFGVGL
jgi:hypothetical protein